MTSEEAPETSIPINLKVRCDACSARAKYLILLAVGRLFFCGHHFKKHRSELEVLPSQITIVDLETNSKIER